MLPLKQKIRQRWAEKALQFKAKPQATIEDLEFRKLNCFVVSQYLNSHDVIADIACGNGHATALYSQKVKFAQGIDYLPAFIAIATKKYKKLIKEGRLGFKTADILDLKERRLFDKVICERTLNNLVSWADQKRALLNLHRILKKNGLLLLTEPTVQGHASVDKVRLAFNINPLTKYWNNFYLDEVKFEQFIKPYFNLEEKRHFGTYQLISKIFYPLFVYPKAQTFRSKINRLARQIAEVYPGNEGISHTVLYLLSKK